MVFSWSVYFSNRTESYSAQIEFSGPHGITENQATYLHCGGEARAKKRARPPAICRKASRRKRREQTQARRDVDRLRSSQARASETVEETAARRDVERLRSSQARAAETVEDTLAVSIPEIIFR